MIIGLLNGFFGSGGGILAVALLGSAVGAWGLKKISAPLLKLLFSLLILYSAIRLLTR